MKYRWSIAGASALPSASGLPTELANGLARQLGLSPLLAQCLLNRGLCDPDRIARFIEPRLKHLADPFALPNMDKAVARLLAARDRAERVVIFGDYDVDGITATALLWEVLKVLGWQIDYYLPHRMDEGYGLTQAGVENCLAKIPATLMLAVDCGSKASPVNDCLRKRRVDLIVVDHHQISSSPPEAIALVNPRLGSDFHEFCSAGLAFKLAHALVKECRAVGCAKALDLDLRQWLDLVALGTIADLVPLTGENRVLVTAGLARLNRTERTGLLALKRAANIAGAIGGYEVSFQLAPRLNAAGRLETALDALHLLLTENAEDAERLAAGLDAQNRHRQEIERGIVEEVAARVRAYFDPQKHFVIVEGKSGWHVGVVGIVASRIAQEFYRPTIILGGDDTEWRGSGRSIPGFDIAGGLEDCNDLLVRHGGHAMAAGLTIEPARLPAFRDRLNQLAQSALQPEHLEPVLRIDGAVKANELDWKLLKELERLEQTGMGNPGVNLLLRNLEQRRPYQRIGSDKQHVKFWVTDGTAIREAVWWNAAQRALPDGRFDMAFSPQLAEFNGTFGVQLKVLDWRPAEAVHRS